MVLLPHNSLVQIKSQDLRKLAYLLWRRAFFQGAVDFEYAPGWTLFPLYVQNRGREERNLGFGAGLTSNYGILLFGCRLLAFFFQPISRIIVQFLWRAHVGLLDLCSKWTIQCSLSQVCIYSEYSFIIYQLRHDCCCTSY